MREFVKAGELAGYLKSLAVASMFVISISTPVFEIGSTVKSTFELAHLAESQKDFFGEGPYWVESSGHDGWTEKSWPDPLIARYASVWTIQVTMNRSGRVVGGYSALMESLKGFEILEQKSPLQKGTGVLLVKQPSDPVDLEALREVLSKYSVFFAIDDGSGFFHVGNMFRGNGLYSS